MDTPHTPCPRHQRISKFSEFPFGVAYYPEHWDRAWLKADAERMASANVNTVRMAEFAWTLMEPQPGKYDFSLFHDAIGELAGQGIQTILCTPTAAPPRWMSFAHPDWMRENFRGEGFDHGTRQHFCTNNPEFRAESRQITRAMAEAFAGSPSVVGWQTDNELYCHIDECYCASCHAGFRAWLVEKYGDIARLNTAWGTPFWSQQYDGFEQVMIPKQGRQPAPCNPTALLDFRRYLSDSIRAFQKEQVDILREVHPRWWITHNGMFDHIDYYRFAEDLDFLSVDVYPAFWGTKPLEFVGSAQLNERCRAASGSYIVPEQCGGPGGQLDFLQPTPEPGRMRLWAFQSVAHGADGILHFRWRTCRYGAEIHWHGILDHDNVPRRRFEEFAQEGSELRRIGQKILGTAMRVDVGICCDYGQDMADSVMSMGRPSPQNQRETALRHLLTHHIAAGFVQQADLFDGLRVLILTSAIMVDEGLAKKMEAFVSAGGILLATATTGQRDLHNNAIAETPPGLLGELFGVRVAEFGKTMHRKMVLESDFASAPADYYEILECGPAESLAKWKFEENPATEAAEGTTGLSVHSFGKGKAFYLGTFLTKENVVFVLNAVCQAAEISPLADAAPCVEITERRNASRRLTFCLNHSPAQQEVREIPEGIDLLTEKSGPLTLEAFGVAIVESPAD